MQTVGVGYVQTPPGCNSFLPAGLVASARDQRAARVEISETTHDEQGTSMHELSLCQAIVDTVTAHADGQHVERVEVRIGHFRQVVPDSLLFSWELLTADTDLAGCELIIDHVPAVITCRSCGQDSTLETPIMLCRSCDSSDVNLVSGEEFLIASIDRTQEVR